MAQNSKTITSHITMKRLQLLNRYYKITQFYAFLKQTAIKGGIVVVAFALVLLFLEYFFLDFNYLLNTLVATYSAEVIISFFLVSETVLGLVPPELFIAWASKSAMPWLFLFILASMSYLGGIIAYFIGNRLFLIPAVKNHIENKIALHITNLRKWGGLFVFIGAMLPLPHSIVSLACGLIKYNFKHYLLWALFRYLRFVIYALIIFQIF
ncbi:membrane protein YqaA with SNARE-associated domain [Flavobacterium sp. PL11]|uniref:YqaA family protein n=1 Tax=Flavobacterium sp. PL11 TaxID=3071717 RepID=UPI002E01033E|nr:membrane protein YqaA with SNARE-associated domain [Flavobacterium sp. PL11]